MKQIACILALALMSCSATERPDSETTTIPASGPASTLPAVAWPGHLPIYDHIVIVIEENKDWSEIIDNADAPHINMMKDNGALFTKSFGLEHHSQGNYYWLFSGSNQDVGFNDKVPATCDDEPPFDCTDNYPFDGSNLGQQLIANNLSFKGYSENLPAIGSTVDHTTEFIEADGTTRKVYARKHVPWISFSNVPNTEDADTSSNLRFANFPTDFKHLPTVSFVIPDLQNDMHNIRKEDDPTLSYCNGKGSVCAGDTWLRDNLGDYYDWVQDDKNNSLLIFTFDENTGFQAGLTEPGLTIPDGETCEEEQDPDNRVKKTACGEQNRVVTIFTGARIEPFQYDEGNGITHVNILRTIESMYGLPKSGAQSQPAVDAGITDDFIIIDVFRPAR